MNSFDVSSVNFDNLVAKAGGKKEALLKVSEKIQELGLSNSVPNGQYKRFTNIDVLGEQLTVDIYKNLDGSVTNVSNMWKP